jgi:phosphorylcholine metabolism protein LicD
MYFDRETINFVQSSRSIIEEREKRKIHARDSIESIFDHKRSRIRTFSSNRELKITNSKKRSLRSSSSNVNWTIFLSFSITRMRNFTVVQKKITIVQKKISKRQIEMNQLTFYLWSESYKRNEYKSTFADKSKVEIFNVTDWRVAALWRNKWLTLENHENDQRFRSITFLFRSL